MNSTSQANPGDLVALLRHLSDSVRINGAAHVYRGTKTPDGEALSQAATLIEDQGKEIDNLREMYRDACRATAESSNRAQAAEAKLAALSGGQNG